MLHRFERPQSIAEAARLLASGPWAVLAGGTDLYPAHVGRRIAAPLLDITAIAGLRGIRRDDRGWTIGATTTWTDVVRADLPPLFDALKAAAREVGGVQIQNAGTVAGNLCNASPAADGTPVLLALGARVVLQSERGERELALERVRARQPAHGARRRRAGRRGASPGALGAGALGVRQARRPALPDDLDQHGRRRRRRRCERRDRRSRRRRRQLLGGRQAPAGARGAPASASPPTPTSPACSSPPTSRR